tara:strand:- start:366 stop:740 length:375 start_codon:yes stop_codon:yes gene_type:complete
MFNVANGFNVGGAYVLPSFPETFQSTVFWQHSDNFFRHTPSIVDYTAAEYIIADRRGKAIIYLTLNNGVFAYEGDLIIHVDDSVIDFRGDYYHQLVLFDAGGNKLPPEFKTKLKVERVFLNEAN